MTTSDAAPPLLTDRYESEGGTVYLSGTQALIRLAFDQRRADERAGLRTSLYISGYPGAPLGGIQTALNQAKPLLAARGILHRPAQNEESAATALMGTQMLDEHPHPDTDGVVAFWYGKGPGIDRAGDAMKHGNFAGTSRLGAVVILSGEDHEAKSSTVPFQQEFAFEHFGIPVLYPASIEEFLEFGRHAVALSRFSGCWVALKLVNTLCDAGQTVDLDHTAPDIVIPDVLIDGKPFQKRANFKFFPGLNLETERQLYHERHVAARAYARANRLDRIEVAGQVDRIGLAASGKAYTDTRQALRDLGFDDPALTAAGIRLLRIGMPCPLDDVIVREFANGLDEIIVIEEKRDFLERQISNVLTKTARAPRVLGKTDEDGAILFPVQGGLDNDIIAEVLARRLAARAITVPEAGIHRLAVVDTVRRRRKPSLLRRTPNFCSGCPHAKSTRLAPGQIAWGAPGCHIYAMLVSDPRRTIDAVTQFGGEGLPWLGLSPYTSRRHVVQNVGDGSLFHASYLNIRHAVAAGVSMTFKILYNGAVANTGGQTPVAARSVPELAALLALEGVVKAVIASREPSQYRAALPRNAEARDVDELEATLAELAGIEGVTVLIADGTCANERRRRQKRGRLPPTTRFTVVNEDLCENCGHCGELANCMSLQKVQTALGLKTRIHQSSCNQDQSCVQAECPSFLTVETAVGGGPRRPVTPAFDEPIPPPPPLPLDRPYRIYMPGVGGTGVITVNAVLAQAAAMDGLQVHTYDQTGGTQKWGAVLSSLILTPQGVTRHGYKVAVGEVDLYLALDPVAASEPANLDRCMAGRTVAVINSSVLPTAEMIRDVRLAAPTDAMIEAIAAVTMPSRNRVLDARAIAEALSGDYMLTNMVAVGAACQAGLLPISPANVEAAIRFNGVQVAANLQAFRAGRLTVADPDRLTAALALAPAPLADRFAEFELVPSPARCRARDRLLSQFDDADETTRNLLRERLEDLIDYQGVAYAERHAVVVRRVLERERAVPAAAGDHIITRAVIRNLHRLMAYKDEYEVARLLTQTVFRERLASQFDSSARFFFHLRPPSLRRFGLRKKVAVGAWARPLLAMLKGMRGLRGTALDPFGRNPVRREERRLIDWYVGSVTTAVESLTPANWDTVLAIAEVPSEIRGYDEIKLRSAEAARQRADVLLGEITR